MGTDTEETDTEEIGILGLCLLSAARQRSLPLLRETLGEIGNTLTEREGLRTYRTVQLDLTQADRDWLKGQMLKLYDSHASRCVPYTAYLWSKIEEKPLSEVVTFRLPPEDCDRLDQLAKAAGISRSAYARKMFRDQLSASQ